MADALAAMVAPDETVRDLLRALRSSRGTGLPCLDAHLPGGRLGPSELLVLLGEERSGVEALLHGILAAFVSPAATGGHALPAVLVDTEGSFDALGFARLLEGRLANTAAAAAGCGAPLLEGSVADLVEEALSRLLVLRPREPADLLKQLLDLRTVLAANPTASCIVVDSMSSWQPLARAYPRSVAAMVREAWRALSRLQCEHCVSVVATCSTADLRGDAALASGRRLIVAPAAPAAGGGSRFFSLAGCGTTAACSSVPRTTFTVSALGDVLAAAC